jgi:hypothetical protein
MQLEPQRIYIKDPSADTVQVLTGDFAGEINLDNQIYLLQDSASACDIKCASPCQNQIWQIEFNDVDFGDCNDCGKSIGFKVRLQRNPDFDNQTYLDYSQLYAFVYQGNKSGTVTAADLATYFLEYFQDIENQADQHDLFLAEVEIDPSNSNAILLTLPCDGLVTYEFEGIYMIPDNNLETAEEPVFTLTQEGADAYYSRERLLQHAPLLSGHVYGEYPKEFFSWCEDSCLILLTGCISPCDKPYEYQNSGHLHVGGTPFQLEIIVNSSYPTYADFINALNAAFTPCDLSTAPGVNAPAWQGEISGGSADVDITTLDFADGDKAFTLSNGAATITVTDVTDGADLATKLGTVYPSGTFAFAAGPPALLTVSGPFAATAVGDFVTLEEVVPYHGGGE